VRLSTQLVLLALIMTIAHWAARAPDDPRLRAQYVCTPVRVASEFAFGLEAALRDAGKVEPAEASWRWEPGRACASAVLRLSNTDVS
jgi:hypothetical protein